MSSRGVDLPTRYLRTVLVTAFLLSIQLGGCGAVLDQNWDLPKGTQSKPDGTMAYSRAKGQAQRTSSNNALDQYRARDPAGYRYGLYEFCVTQDESSDGSVECSQSISEFRIAINAFYDVDWERGKIRSKRAALPKWYKDRFAISLNLLRISKLLKAKKVAIEFARRGAGTYAADGTIFIDEGDLYSVFDHQISRSYRTVNGAVGSLNSLADRRMSRASYSKMSDFMNSPQGKLVQSDWGFINGVEFLVLHEFGHIYLGHLKQEVSRDCQEEELREREADKFAQMALSELGTNLELSWMNVLTSLEGGARTDETFELGHQAAIRPVHKTGARCPTGSVQTREAPLNKAVSRELTQLIRKYLAQ